ncbi:Prefoldin subunit-domain-containing protein [Rhodotorula diobovata]|uniref:Prefoldin subunit 4 n=1 Tax=Rhodotorula diobovata TaxID=5288 RepID=A0A5C5FZC2_9BASI|nr:Prefoldin subunit-domain-containing protein [Rhodotorula diobovata]
MRMLDKDESATDAQVTRQDQDRINSFSRLNSRTDEIVDLLDSLVKLREDLEEVETELELVDDDELVMYKLDTTFVHLAAPEALSHLQAQLDKIRSEVDALEAEKDECAQQMDLLKKDLYAKFGTSINLERGDD